LQHILQVCNAIQSRLLFQFPFPRDSFCNICPRVLLPLGDLEFQFPFPRDSFCNFGSSGRAVEKPSSFSSLFLGIPFATRIPKSDLEKAKWRFSSLFLGIPFATGKDRFYQSRKLKEFQFPFPRDSFCNWMRKAWRRSGRRRGFSSLFLGIPFATGHRSVRSGRESLVSVPFSSGFLLQHSGGREKV